ncbi:hypothetical protein [Methanobrevibacter sp.]|uniref:hypothetical protein n=1 Tax=Methanobrevibacter sp. TaxID=66852 RepID=UPI003868B3F6
MSSKRNVEYCILNSAIALTNIKGLDKDIAQFVKGIVLMLCDKFVCDESLSTTISNLVGGNMKIVEDYAQRVAQRKVDEKMRERNEEIVINLSNEGYGIEDIVRIANVSLDFVRNALSK